MHCKPTIGLCCTHQHRSVGLQAYAAARFSESVLRGLEGEPDVYEAAYVESSVTELPYFATKVRLGPNGAEEVLPLGKLTPFEEKGVQELIPVLKKNIDTGVEFAQDEGGRQPRSERASEMVLTGCT